MSIALLLLTALAVLAVVSFVVGLRRTGILLGATLLACVTYLALGIVVPRVVRAGHFVSIPFGGYQLSDSRILLSLLFWLVLYAVALGLLVRRRSPTEKE